MLKNLWNKVTSVFAPRVSDEELKAHLDKLREQAPVPVFWLLGKTQSGKTSLVRYITGAERAEIGKGFKPCTRFSSKYLFPTEQAPMLSFLDTRGLDEPGYDASEDIGQFHQEAHVVLVTVRLLDHAQENVLKTLAKLRAASPKRPVVLVVTCLHEAYPQQQHVQPYPFEADGSLGIDLPPQLQNVRESLEEQRRRFGKYVDRIVPVDLTPPDEGFDDPNYGGTRLRDVLFELLPAAQSQTLRTLQVAQRDLQDLFACKATPTIAAYSTLAATAGAVPFPVLDLVLISTLQTKMVYDLANLYGQPLDNHRFKELASALGLGILSRQAGRSLIKVIPGLGSVLGSVAGGALAAASTYALGKAFCYYYRVMLEGHVPNSDELRRYYQEQFTLAESTWKNLHEDSEKKGDAKP
jgi:uncharacterized protein (DUF697 family)